MHKECVGDSNAINVLTITETEKIIRSLAEFQVRSASSESTLRTDQEESVCPARAAMQQATRPTAGPAGR